MFCRTGVCNLSWSEATLENTCLVASHVVFILISVNCGCVIVKFCLI